jgi:hypothetical protein
MAMLRRSSNPTLLIQARQLLLGAAQQQQQQQQQQMAAALLFQQQQPRLITTSSAAAFDGGRGFSGSNHYVPIRPPPNWGIRCGLCLRLSARASFAAAAVAAAAAAPATHAHNYQNNNPYKQQPTSIVPEKTAFVVERFGKFNKVLGSGLHFLIPMVSEWSCF